MGGERAPRCEAAATTGLVASAFAAWRTIPARYFAIALAIGLVWGLANTFGWWLASGMTSVPRRWPT